MCVCPSIYICVCMYVCACVYVCVCIYAFMYVSPSVCVQYVYTHICQIQANYRRSSILFSNGKVFWKHVKIIVALRTTCRVYCCCQKARGQFLSVSVVHWLRYECEDNCVVIHCFNAELTKMLVCSLMGSHPQILYACLIVASSKYNSVGSFNYPLYFLFQFSFSQRRISCNYHFLTE